jgi:hypothetical protein
MSEEFGVNQMGFTEADKASLLRILNGKRCLACGSLQLTLGDGYVALTLQSNLPSINLTAPHIQMVALSCRDCGFTSLWKVDLRTSKKGG